MTYEELVKKLSPKLKAITHKLDGRYTVFSDDDLYQEALFHLWEKYRQGALDDKTDSYILQGCYFFLKNYIRTIYTRIDAKSLSIEKPINENNDTLEKTLPQRAIGEEYSNIYAQLLHEEINESLEAKEEKILQLFLESSTVREIGKIMGVSHVMVVKTLNKIRVKCKKFKEEIVK
jgi:RNA polymerase sigma factor (sigma-70 family)